MLNFNKYENAGYWTHLIQLAIYDHIKNYLETNNISRKDFAEKLGVTKGYVSQIMNGQFDHKLSKLVELILACDIVPKIEFVPAEYAEEVAKDTYLESLKWIKQSYARNDFKFKRVKFLDFYNKTACDLKVEQAELPLEGTWTDAKRLKTAAA